MDLTRRGIAGRALTVAVCVLIVAGLAHLVAGDREPGIDRHAFGLLALMRGSALAQAATPASKIAPVVLALVVLGALVVLLRRRAWPSVGAILAGFMLCDLGAHLAKAAAARPRPSGGLVSAGGFSFPSTSSALCVGFAAVAIAFARLAPTQRAWRVAIALSCLLAFVAGLLFIAIRVHYLTDVLAGWAFGIAAFTVADLAALVLWRMLGLSRSSLGAAP